MKIVMNRPHAIRVGQQLTIQGLPRIVTHVERQVVFLRDKVADDFRGELKMRTGELSGKVSEKGKVADFLQKVGMGGL